MNHESQFTKSKTRLVVGLGFLVAGLVWMVVSTEYMLNAYRHSTPDTFTVLIDIVVFGFFVFCGGCLISTEKLWKIILGFGCLLMWSLGFFVIPRPPEGYEEVVYTGYWFLLLLPFFIYYKYRKSRNANKNNLPKDT